MQPYLFISVVTNFWSFCIKINKSFPPPFSKRYEKLYEGNTWIKRSRNQATYLQSKIYRAKEKIDHELEKVEIVADNS